MATYRVIAFPAKAREKATYVARDTRPPPTAGVTSYLQGEGFLVCTCMLTFRIHVLDFGVEPMIPGCTRGRVPERADRRIGLTTTRTTMDCATILFVK
eukprot:12777485-Alexandrium_andersonii.AAC.1